MTYTSDDLPIRTDALTRPLSAGELRRARGSVGARRAGERARTGRSRLAVAGGYAATAVVLVIVVVYLVGADLELLPIVGALVLAFGVYAAVTGVRRRRRSAEEDNRLDLLAAENDLEISRDLVDPDLPGLLLREGTERRVPIRLRQERPRRVEVGRYRAVASPLDGGRPLDIGYVVLRDPEAALRWASADAPPPQSSSSPPTGPVGLLGRLPALHVEGLPEDLRVDVSGDDVVLYSPQPFDLGKAATWSALREAVRRAGG